MNYNNIDCVDLFNIYLNKSSYMNTKKLIINENKDLKNFLEIKEKILKDNFIPLN